MLNIGTQSRCLAKLVHSLDEPAADSCDAEAAAKTSITPAIGGILSASSSIANLQKQPYRSVLQLTKQKTKQLRPELRPATSRVGVGYLGSPAALLSRSITSLATAAQRSPSPSLEPSETGSAAASARSLTEPPQLKSWTKNLHFSALTSVVGADPPTLHGPALRQLRKQMTCAEDVKRISSLESSLKLNVVRVGSGTARLMTSIYSLDCDGFMVISKPGMHLDALTPEGSTGGINFDVTGASNIGDSKYLICPGNAFDGEGQPLNREPVRLDSLPRVGISGERGAAGVAIGLVFVGLNAELDRAALRKCHQTISHKAYTRSTGKLLSSENFQALHRVSLSAGADLKRFCESYRELISSESRLHGPAIEEAFEHIRTYFLFQHGNRNSISSSLSESRSIGSPVTNEERSKMLQDSRAWVQRNVQGKFDLAHVQSVSLQVAFQFSILGATLYAKKSFFRSEYGPVRGTSGYSMVRVESTHFRSESADMPKATFFSCNWLPGAGTIQMDSSFSFISDALTDHGQSHSCHLDHTQVYNAATHLMGEKRDDRKKDSLTDLSNFNYYERLPLSERSVVLSAHMLEQDRQRIQTLDQRMEAEAPGGLNSGLRIECILTLENDHSPRCAGSLLCDPTSCPSSSFISRLADKTRDFGVVCLERLRAGPELHSMVYVLHAERVFERKSTVLQNAWACIRHIAVTRMVGKVNHQVNEKDKITVQFLFRQIRVLVTNKDPGQHSELDTKMRKACNGFLGLHPTYFELGPLLPKDTMFRAKEAAVGRRDDARNVVPFGPQSALMRAQEQRTRAVHNRAVNVVRSVNSGLLSLSDSLPPLLRTAIQTLHSTVCARLIGTKQHTLGFLEQVHASQGSKDWSQSKWTSLLAQEKKGSAGIMPHLHANPSIRSFSDLISWCLSNEPAAERSFMSKDVPAKWSEWCKARRELHKMSTQLSELNFNFVDKDSDLPPWPMVRAICAEGFSAVGVFPDLTPSSHKNWSRQWLLLEISHAEPSNPSLAPVVPAMATVGAAASWMQDLDLSNSAQKEADVPRAVLDPEIEQRKADLLNHEETHLSNRVVFLDCPDCMEAAEYWYANSQDEYKMSDTDKVEEYGRYLKSLMLTAKQREVAKQKGFEDALSSRSTVRNATSVNVESTGQARSVPDVPAPAPMVQIDLDTSTITPEVLEAADPIVGNSSTIVESAVAATAPVLTVAHRFERLSPDNFLADPVVGECMKRAVQAVEEATTKQTNAMDYVLGGVTTLAPATVLVAARTLNALEDLLVIDVKADDAIQIAGVTLAAVLCQLLWTEAKDKEPKNHQSRVNKQMDAFNKKLDKQRAECLKNRRTAIKEGRLEEISFRKSVLRIGVQSEQ